MASDKTLKTKVLTAQEEAEVAFFDQQSGAFFRKVDWGAFWTAFLVTFISYWATLAPTVTLEDSGELAVASDYLGVPHPPGYPIWTLYTWFFQWIFGWVRYYGYPNPAWGVGLSAAFAGAMACGILALMVSRSGADMLRGMRRTMEIVGVSTENLFCWVAGVAAGLLLAFSPVMWSQSVIVEVYSLNAFFQMIIMLFMYRWMSRPKEDQSLYTLAFLFGLGLTNHQTLMFLGLGLAVGVMLKDIRLFRDFAVVGTGIIAIVLINKWAAANRHPEMMWLSGPHSTAFWVYMILAVLLPIAGLLLPRGKTVCISFLLFYVGLAFYGFMPFASDQNPPINWGYPRTWEGFIHAITRGQYEKITLTDIFSTRFIAQIGSYLSDLRGQFTLPIVLFGFLPFCAWNLRLRGRDFSAFLASMALAAGATVLIVLQGFLPETGLLHAFLTKLYKLLTLGIMIMATVGVIVLFLKFIVPLFTRQKAAAGDADPDLFGIHYEMTPALQRWLIATLVSFISLGIILIAFQNPQLDIQTLFIGRVQFIQSHAVYAVWLGYGLVFGLTHLEVLTGGRGRIKGLAILLVFLLPLVLVYQNYFDKDQVRIVGGAEQNGHDFGWQFGNWQLRGVNGISNDYRYLSKGDEADFQRRWKDYPTPGYPPEMGTNAIFFGGTDPGRFVPTYMVYCPPVRPDVYLITQNALADNTYMSVMRDLYGDRIWIPSQQDSNYAFQQYVEDVQAGRIPPGAEVSFENGRVSVQGVQGVMMINGILAKMIFEANKYKHDFYVEESYVIPWMYPYLEPHGLIMKINREMLPGLTPQMVENDTKFWDWYCNMEIGRITNLAPNGRVIVSDNRPENPAADDPNLYVPKGTRVEVISVDPNGVKKIRLGGNWKFLHDVVARKTFSKLRSAIAGLYAYRRMFREAEYAFKQAVELYPLSPEANFRLADIYMQMGRFSDARLLIEDFLRNDPGNDKVAEFLNQIKGTEGADARRQELEGVLSSGQADINSALELSDLYRKMGRENDFIGLTMNILNNTNLPPQYYMAVAQLYADAKRIDLLAVALQRYVMRDPGNPRAWIDLAAALTLTQKRDEALEAIRRAIQTGGPQAQDIIRKDNRFDALRNNPAFKELIPQAAPAKLPSNLPLLPGL